MTKEEVVKKLQDLGREIQSAKEELSKLDGREEQILQQLDQDFSVKDSEMLDRIIVDLIQTNKRAEEVLIEKYKLLAAMYEV